MTKHSDNFVVERSLDDSLKPVINALNRVAAVQEFALLGEDKDLEFVYDDHLIKLHIPYALHEFIQRKILHSNTFYEDGLLRRLRQMALFDESGTYFDVGANIGNHTVYFSKIMGSKHVTAFEPQNVAHKILKRNVNINDLERDVTVVKSLIGSQDGSGALEHHFGTRNLGATSFREADDGGVSMTSLDAYCANNGVNDLEFVKIDVEGMQVPVFEGCKTILGDLKPTIWVELRDFKGEFEETEKILAQYGYVSRQLGKHDHIFMVRG